MNIIDRLPQKIKNIITHPTFPQFIKFSLVGVLNTIVFYVIYYVMLQLGVFYVVAAATGTTAGIVNSYVINRKFVFKSSKMSVGEVVKFLIVYGVQYLSNITVIHICVEYIGISAELGGILAIGVGVFISFFGHKFWSFRKVEK